MYFTSTWGSLFRFNGFIVLIKFLKKKKKIILFGPKGLDDIINLQLKLSYSELTFNLEFHPLKSSSLIRLYEDSNCSLFSFGLKHRIPCWGFKLVEKKPKVHIKPSSIKEFNIPFSFLNEIKLGKDFINNNGVLTRNSLLTKDSYIPRSYAYCSDTKFFRNLPKLIEGVDLLYHEATFHSDLCIKARSYFHSTSLDAAIVAKKANVKRLILGHFSSRYKDLTILQKDAKKVFNNVDLAEEGKTWKIKKIYSK